MTRNLVLFEEHGEVLSHWCHQHYHDETVVCFDHHLDLKKIAEPQVDRMLKVRCDVDGLRALNRDLPFRDDDKFAYGLDSFLYAAMRLGFVSHLIWVVTEPRPLSSAQLGWILWENVSLIPGHGHEALRNFKVGRHSASTQVFGKIVEVTTEKHLPSLGLTPKSRVDFDLDYFCDESGHLVHDITTTLETLSKTGLAANVETATFSISSGFLPSSFRYLGPTLAQYLSVSIEMGSEFQGRPLKALQALTSKNIADKTQLLRLWNEELSPLGGPGWSMRSVLAIRALDTRDAEYSYQRAIDEGDRASWAAYAIGLHYLKAKNYAQGAHWFARSIGGGTDTLQARSIILTALCYCRVGSVRKAYVFSRRAVNLLPMRPDGYRIAALCAESLGHHTDAKHFRNQCELLGRLLTNE
jgi:hypothetical protein